MTIQARSLDRGVQGANCLEARLLCTCGGHGPELASGERSQKLALQKHRLPSQISGLHDPTKRLSHVGRKRIAIVQSIFCDRKLTLGIENHEVRIEPRRNASLAPLAARE